MTDMDKIKMTCEISKRYSEEAKVDYLEMGESFEKIASWHEGRVSMCIAILKEIDKIIKKEESK
jgi:hypothetical protein